MGVIRGSFLSFWRLLHSARACGSDAISSASRRSASTCMVLSFQQRKTRPLRPTRACE